MTKAVADANRISYLSSVMLNGCQYVMHSWQGAKAYCTGLGGQLPTLGELKALYNTRGDMKLYGWPTQSGYWSSTEVSPGYHYGIQLSSGFSYSTHDVSGSLVTCVR